MKGKCVLWTVVDCIIVVGLIPVIHGCIWPTSKKESASSLLHDLDSSTRCVSECVTADSPLREFDRQMCLAASSEKDLEYWIDGERETPGCHWHLTHVECQRGRCLYRCRETEALWFLSQQGNSNLKMTKSGKSSTFQRTYIFSAQSAGKIRKGIDEYPENGGDE